MSESWQWRARRGFPSTATCSSAAAETVYLPRLSSTESELPCPRFRGRAFCAAPVFVRRSVASPLQVAGAPCRRRGRELFTKSDARKPAILLKAGLEEKSMDSITNASSGFQSNVRAPAQTTTASIAVICAFAAIGPLATNIFLPSLPAIANDLHVSSAL